MSGDTHGWTPGSTAPGTDYAPPPGGPSEPQNGATATSPAVWGWAPGVQPESLPAEGRRVDTTNPSGAAPAPVKRPRREFSGRRLAVIVLVILLMAGAGAGGVAYGYAQGKTGTAEYYQPRLADAQSQLASDQAILAKQSADAAAVPNLAAVAAKHPGMGALNQTATSLEVNVRSTDPDGKIVAVYAFMTELGFTGATLDRMGKTRALDGTLTAQGRNCNVSWAYRPDNGLQMVFEAKAG